MKTFTLVSEIDTLPPEVASSIRDILDSLPPEDTENLETLSELLGGDVFLIEAAEDLHQIKTAAYDASSDSWHDVTSIVYAPDAIEQLGGDNGHWMWFLANNNAGGPSYYIPNEIFIGCENLLASSEMMEGK